MPSSAHLAKQSFQTHSTQPQTSERALDLPDRQRRRVTVAEALALPALCGPQDLAAIWGITHSQFCRLNKRGAFDFLKVKPAVGPKQFSGVLVGRWLSGEPVYLPTFGRKRS